jgi:hypothetical protein
MGKGNNVDFFKIDTPFLETPDRDHVIARYQLAYDTPEIFRGLIGHAPHGVITMTESERDMSSGCG